MLTLTIIMMMLVAMLVLGLLGDTLWFRETPEVTEVASANRERSLTDASVEISTKGSASVDSLAA